MKRVLGVDAEAGGELVVAAPRHVQPHAIPEAHHIVASRRLKESLHPVKLDIAER